MWLAHAAIKEQKLYDSYSGITENVVNSNNPNAVVTIFTDVESDVVLRLTADGGAAVADYYEIYRLAKGQIKPINFPQIFLFAFACLSFANRNRKRHTARSAMPTSNSQRTQEESEGESKRENISFFFRIIYC